MYLSKLVFFIKEMPGVNFESIIEIIKSLKNKNFTKVIKIYILKLFYNFMNNNFEEFQKFDYKKAGIDFFDEFLYNKKNKVDAMLTYFFLPLEEEDYIKYLELSKLFLKNMNFNMNNKEISNYTKKVNFDIFICISINKIISNLCLKNYDEEIFRKFSDYTKILFKDKNEDLRQLLSIFYDFETYKNKIKKKLIDKDKNEINQLLFEALLYGFRFCVNSLDKSTKEKELLFSSILTKNCINIIDHSLIPGNDNKEDLHLTTLEMIEFHFKTFPDSYGCYVCSCGFYYYIDSCGFPTINSSRRTLNCPYCG